MLAAYNALIIPMLHAVSLCPLDLLPCVCFLSVVKSSLNCASITLRCFSSALSSNAVRIGSLLERAICRGEERKGSKEGRCGQERQ